MNFFTSRFLMSVLAASLIGCGSTEQPVGEQGAQGEDYKSSQSADANPISFDSGEITQDKFEENERVGEEIFSKEVISELVDHSLEENDQSTTPTQTQVAEQATDFPEPASDRIVPESDYSQNDTDAQVEDEQVVDTEEETEELGDAYDEEKYNAALALAQSEMNDKIDAMIPNAPSFMKDKLKENADDLLYCGDDCEDKAKDLMVTSYSISRFLDSRGLALTATDIDAALSAGSKLISDIALIIVEATSPSPDPTTIIMLVEIFIADLRELIMAFVQE